MAGEFFKNGQISVRVKLVDPDVSGPIPIDGTITIDSITNAVHIVVDDPIDIASIPNLTIVAMPNLNVSTMPDLNIASLPAITLADIVNLNVDSLPALTGTLSISSIGGTVTIGGVVSMSMVEPPVSLTIPPQTTVNVSNVDILLLAANPNRKFLNIRNYSNSNAYVFLHFGATAATVGSGIPLKQEEWYEFPKGFIYTGQIRAISGTAALKEIAITEGT
jgi:hypothetical protein